MEVIWYTFLEVSQIQDLKKVPVTDHPEHQDVKAIMFMYSLDCFLFGRLNKISRDKDSSAIETLGPFAVALTKIINNIQQKRRDKIRGPFKCFRGLALSQEVIDKWTKSSHIELDGYNSTSLDLPTALTFADQAFKNPSVQK